MEDKNSYVITQTKKYIDRKIKEFSGENLVELPTDVAMEAAYNDVRVFLEGLERSFYPSLEDLLPTEKYCVTAYLSGVIEFEVKAVNDREAQNKANDVIKQIDFDDLDNVEWDVKLDHIK